MAILHTFVVTTPTEANESGLDSLTHEASRYVIGLGYASTSKLKEQFQLGHTRATSLMRELEERGIVGPRDGNKPRRVLIGADEFERVLAGKSVECSAV